ncbi:MAG: putative lipid II flippase FtsW [Actinomycetia bacterium]|nr:putative lipid II flippase FtsW [Actinomycetes bacterium]
MRRIEFPKEYFAILISTILLFAIGIIMVSSSSAEHSIRYYDDPFHILKKHLLHSMAGVVILIFVINIPFNKYKYLSYILIIANIILLILVLIPGFGIKAGGAQSWLDFGVFSIQPSEFVKLSLIIFASDILVRKRNSINRFIHLVIPLLLIVSIITFLVFLQPDLGTAIIIWLFLFTILFVGKVKFRHMFILFIIWLLIVGLFITKAEYRVGRIKSFLSKYLGEESLLSEYLGEENLLSKYLGEENNTEGDDFQQRQALIALGSGGILGKGLGKSIQKLAYLPHPYTDFIFAIIGEELGLLGTISVAVLYLILAICGISICIRIENPLGKLLSIGITTYIVGQALINMSVVSGLLPVTGVPLPLISTGGSSLITSLASIGVLLNVARGEKE